MILISLPAFLNSVTVSLRPLLAATYNGVRPDYARTIASWLRETTTMYEVRVHYTHRKQTLLLWLTSRPALISSVVILLRPLRAAANNMVSPPYAHTEPMCFDIIANSSDTHFSLVVDVQASFNQIFRQIAKAPTSSGKQQSLAILRIYNCMLRDNFKECGRVLLMQYAR